MACITFFFFEIAIEKNTNFTIPMQVSTLGDYRTLFITRDFNFEMESTV